MHLHSVAYSGNGKYQLTTLLNYHKRRVYGLRLGRVCQYMARTKFLGSGSIRLDDKWLFKLGRRLDIPRGVACPMLVLAGGGGNTECMILSLKGLRV